MEFIVLGLLMIQDMTIYQINQAFKSGLSLIYRASYGSLQNAIKNLIQEEAIVFSETVEHGRNKKTYHLTPQGKQRFLDWMMDDLPMNKLELVALSKVFFLGLIQSKAEKQKILEKILSAIKRMESELNALSDTLSTLELPDKAMRIYGYQFKTVEYGVRSHRLAREWVQQILDELD